MKKTTFIFFVLALLLITGCVKKESSSTVNKINDTSVQSDTQELTPEEVLARMDAEEGVGVEQGPVSVDIISPEGDKFQPGQARFYNAKVDGLEAGRSCSCDWKFYLNEYDEETLYETMDDRRCTGSDRSQGLVCGFTSTFVSDRGDLRVTVDVEVKNYQGEVEQTATTEKKYRVQ